MEGRRSGDEVTGVEKGGGGYGCRLAPTVGEVPRKTLNFRNIRQFYISCSRPQRELNTCVRVGTSERDTRGEGHEELGVHCQ